MRLFTANPARRAAELLMHLRGENCSRSREAAECVRRVMIELRGAVGLVSDPDELHDELVTAHEEGR